MALAPINAFGSVWARRVEAVRKSRRRTRFSGKKAPMIAARMAGQFPVKLMPL
jgi:hypothetical protein